MAPGSARVLTVICLLMTVVSYTFHTERATFVAEDGLQAAGAVFAPRGLSNLSWRIFTLPNSSHMLSFYLHLINVWLVGLLALRVGVSVAGAWLASAVFLVHPLTVESVAYASSRTELIAGLGALGALVVMGRAWWRAVAAVALLVFGLWGKETAIVAVLLAPLVLRKLWLLAFSYPIALALISYANIGEDWLARVTWTDWALIQSTAVVRLFSAFVVPLSMAVDYDYDIVPMFWRYTSVGLLAFMSVTVIALYRRFPSVSFGVAWALIAVAPRLVVQTPRSYLNEHQFYLPLVGLAVASGGIMGAQGNRRS